MKKTSILALLLTGLLIGAAPNPHDTIGAIDFFGYQGLDVAKVRTALPVHAGDQITATTTAQIEDAVAAVIGKKPTQVARICCDQDGHLLLYIGLPGATYKPFVFNPVPTGNDQLPEEIVTLRSNAKMPSPPRSEKEGRRRKRMNRRGIR